MYHLNLLCTNCHMNKTEDEVNFLVECNKYDTLLDAILDYNHFFNTYTNEERVNLYYVILKNILGDFIHNAYMLYDGKTINVMCNQYAHINELSSL